jgi:hypothetical protein
VFVAVIFSDLAQASEGARALGALHAEDGIPAFTKRMQAIGGMVVHG